MVDVAYRLSGLAFASGVGRRSLVEALEEVGPRDPERRTSRLYYVCTVRHLRTTDGRYKPRPCRVVMFDNLAGGQVWTIGRGMPILRHDRLKAVR